MNTVQIQVKSRYLSGSDVAKKVRRAGLLPAVVYGGGSAAKSVVVEPRPLRKGLQGPYGRNQLFSLAIDGETGEQLAIAKEVQLHPVTRELRHVDFLRVTAETRIDVTLPVTLVGRSAGQKAGGRLEHITRFVRVSCTPATLPQKVEIDITPFDNGYAMFIEDLPLPAGVTPVFKKRFKIFEVFSVKIEAAAPGDEKKGK